MPLIEGAATAILSAETDRNSFHRKRSQRQRLSHAKVQWPLAVAHLPALLQQLLHLGVDMEILGVFHQSVSDLVQRLSRQTGINFIRRVVRAAVKRSPITR